MAVYPIAAGHPDLSAKTIPELWAQKFNIELYAKTLFGEISNTDYEGEIRQYGDTVTIPTLGAATINDYVKGQKLTYTKQDVGTVQLLIDQGKYFAFPVNQLDVKQSRMGLVPPWIEHNSSSMQVVIDKNILAYVYGQAHASNAGSTAGADSGDINLGVSGTPLQLTKTNILEKIVDCGTVLDEQNIPAEGRWIVFPSWVGGLIKKSDLKDASLTGDTTSIVRNGRLGMIDRFTVYISNNLVKGTDTVSVWNATFGHKIGLTFAAQLAISETLKDQDDFGTLVRALTVFGRKVTKSEAIGHLYIKK